MSAHRWLLLAPLALGCAPTRSVQASPVTRAPDSERSRNEDTAADTPARVDELGVRLEKPPVRAADPADESVDAKYVANLHERLHKSWAWGFLEMLDARPPTHPLNNSDLWARVELVIDREGAPKRIVIVRSSGNAEFDKAAVDVMFWLRPFEPPPPELLSGDGRMYMHWALHRDERACGAFGAQPFILDEPPER